ncbi:unnamed protein product [Malus baccata var. baccata]
MDRPGRVPESATPESLISDRVLINGVVTPVTLFSDGVLRWSQRAERSLIVEKDVLGFAAEGPKIRIRALLWRKDLVFEPLFEESHRLWCQKLRDYIDSLGRPKRLFVFVNPFGGSKSASKIYLDHVKPLFEDAGIQFTLQGGCRHPIYAARLGISVNVLLIKTRYQLHAKEVAKTVDLSKYDGVVCVSGGWNLVICLFLFSRLISDEILSIRYWKWNGKSLLDSVGEPCTLSNAVLAIIRGHKRSLDVATICHGKTKFFSVLMLAWGKYLVKLYLLSGLVADIDIESEKYRWMGSARLDFYAVQRIVRLRQYDGSISFVPAPGFETYGEPTSYSNDSEPANQHIACAPNQEEPINIRQHGYEGPDINLDSMDWRTIRGPFVSIWLHNVPWGDVMLMGACPKLSLLSLMAGLSTGSHIKSPYVLYFKVKAFVLQPGPRAEDPIKGRIIDSDGEVLARGRGAYKCDQKTLMAYDELQITVDQGLATLFSPVYIAARRIQGICMEEAFSQQLAC